MKRRKILQTLSVIVLLPITSLINFSRGFANPVTPEDLKPLNKPPKTWRKYLSPEAYQVLFEQQTEDANSSELNQEHREGTYICAACYLPLFQSIHKYESVSGWPSFAQSIPNHVSTQLDDSIGIIRTEYHCVRCGGHQGHVFKDGPPPTGERWCNNGLSLKFIASTDSLPSLRI